MSQTKKPQLKLDWCSHEAAKYACEHWHYSGCISMGKLVKIGVWEDNRFIGCVLFGRGVNPGLGTPYGLKVTECCELVRIALNQHNHTVSKIVSIAIKMLKNQSPGVRLIVSFADTSRHIGIIYQSMNWMYVGDVPPKDMFINNGELIHQRTAIHRYGTSSGIPELIKVKSGVKHRYLYPLDNEIKQRISKLSKPYPKKPRAVSIESDATSDPTGEGSFNTITALPSVEESAHA